jgi:hypothetical protein
MISPLIHVRCKFPNIKWKLIPKWKITLLSPKFLHVCTHVTILSKNLMAQKSHQINSICKCGDFQKYLTLGDVMFHITFHVTWSHCISCHDFFFSCHICHMTSWHQMIWWHVRPWVLTCLKFLAKIYLWSPNHYSTIGKMKLISRSEKTKRILRLEPPQTSLFPV